MSLLSWIAAGMALGLVAASMPSQAQDSTCRDKRVRGISFIQFQSPNLQANPPGSSALTIKGKLSVPCSPAQDAKLPAVVILHGSSGVDARGDFYEAALNAAGIATLQIDLWEARGVTSLSNRPPAPIYTYPDAFAALAFLAAQPSIDGQRVGVLGFSWGGVISLASAELLYSGQFGGGRRFKAHVANYPVCYGANNTTIPQLQPPAQAGTQFLNLTRAPVLIQIGSRDDYDNGTAACKALAAAVNPSNGNAVQVVEYPDMYHAWDRLMIPVTALDTFANQGSYFSTGVPPTVTIVPNVAEALNARARVVQFFGANL